MLESIALRPRSRIQPDRRCARQDNEALAACAVSRPLCRSRPARLPKPAACRIAGKTWVVEPQSSFVGLHKALQFGQGASAAAQAVTDCHVRTLIPFLVADDVDV